MRCKHEWVIITECVLPSAIEQFLEKAIPANDFEANRGMFQKKYICILCCKKCGKLNKTIEINP